MKRKTYPNSLVEEILREFKSGKAIDTISSERNVPIQTIYSWTKKNRKKQVVGDENNKIQAIRRENAQLKKIVVRQLLTIYKLTGNTMAFI